jgi:hypothetical protein
VQILLLGKNGQCEEADRQQNDGKYCGLHGGPSMIKTGWHWPCSIPSQLVCTGCFAFGSGIAFAISEYAMLQKCHDVRRRMKTREFRLRK